MKEYKYKINGKEYKVAVGEREANNVVVEVNGVSYNVELEEQAQPVVKPVARPAAPAANAAPAAAPAPATAAPAATGTGKGVKSPLPGVILSIKVNVGDAVKKGQTLLVLEAMKMENDIKADADGVVTSILVRQGDSILEGTDLVMIG
ncbi:MAG: biotin/lipoyl-containing protein [Phocaeicola sp.]|nr:biotin/lipoyl-binding protein [Phocaeicola sp.]MDD7448085.1 biotin/lipoyl-binding protein [Prevotellaceae bacterium]MDY3913892.1 biotin/lipoyl-containing protein [Phocaeicola sp.]MDY5938734.1 biotin/lipoyl-containing protein [Phocaeicola sp.]